MSRTLAGQVALVTGASRGIGRAIAQALGRAGATVIGTATSAIGIAAIDQDMQRLGYTGRALELNVADNASVDQFGQLLVQAELTPMILVNNAGVTRDNLLLRMKDDEWNTVINTDLSSVFRLTRLCLRGMMKARAGRIINITSVVALSGNTGQCNYAAAKAGMIGFTRSLAREVGSRGITVNAVAPGCIATDMTDALSEQQRAQLAAQTSLGRLGTVDEVAQVVAFLASPSAAYITGETINVNGGMYMA
ncbi:MAG: 3-oxoacyl-ACP reductase FabG [Gammaproteobacteria bacterium]|nr:3-oxoacyl-ACP reductase FabG [Gammaproteobacteria bacterium]